MPSENPGRRSFVKNSLATCALASLPVHAAFGQVPIGTRLEWNDFRNTSQYHSFIHAIGRMRSNPDWSNRGSWDYWINIHINRCPHGIAYFLAWHRGYLHYFQETLRVLSGDSTLMIPYWDYYKNPVMPAEFTDPSDSNPLFVPDRVNTNVFDALTLTPFSGLFVNFQRGTAYSFEAQSEYRPHSQVHNLIGGIMARMRSPMDPIFWLHHGQMDRLWSAWVAAGAGRQMPPASDAYWSGSFSYSAALSMERHRVRDTTTYLGYRYQDETLPSALPAVAQAGRIIRAQTRSMREGRGAGARPPVGRFPTFGPQGGDGRRRTLGGARQIALGDNSISAQIAVGNGDSKELRAIASGMRASPFARRPQAAPPGMLHIVLDGLHMSRAGAAGGYFYEVYLNLPEQPGASEERYSIGTLGPFEVEMAQQLGGQLVLPATHVLGEIPPGDTRELTVSFVRVNGANTPIGDAILIGELRAELTIDPPR